MKTKNHGFVKAAFVLTTVAVVSWQVTGVGSEPIHNHMGNKTAPSGSATEHSTQLGLNAIYAEQLPGVQQTIRKAIEHIEAGHSQMALKELKDAQASLQMVRKTLGLHVVPQFVNARCPIMGSPINPEKVNASLVRTYNGQRVAFCCGGCPGAWDKLSDAQKAAKLKAVVSSGQPKHMQHQH